MIWRHQFAFEFRGIFFFVSNSPEDCAARRRTAPKWNCPELRGVRFVDTSNMSCDKFERRLLGLCNFSFWMIRDFEMELRNYALSVLTFWTNHYSVQWHYGWHWPARRVRPAATDIENRTLPVWQRCESIGSADVPCLEGRHPFASFPIFLAQYCHVAYTLAPDPSRSRTLRTIVQAFDAISSVSCVRPLSVRSLDRKLPRRDRLRHDRHFRIGHHSSRHSDSGCSVRPPAGEFVRYFPRDVGQTLAASE